MIYTKRDALHDFLSGWELEDLADGAWWAFLEEGVVAFNREENTKFDPHEAVLTYIQQK